MKRSVPFLLAATIGAAAVVPVADAATRTRVGVDKKRQVSFTLTGRSITVNLREVDGTVNPLAAKLSGSEIVLACRGRAASSKVDRTADLDATWERDALSFTGMFARDISSRVRWCLLERPDGSDLAVTLKMSVARPVTAAPPA